MEIRPLRQEDDRRTFSSGDPDLDSFLLKYAGQNQFRHHIGTTYVAIEGGSIMGYATVAPGQMEIESLPVSRRKGLPSYPLPILRLARLAVDQRTQGRGIGKVLLRAVLLLAHRMAAEFGCIGVVVDAKAGAQVFYERFGFMRIDVDEGQMGTRPQPVEMFLSMAEIEAAIGRAR